MDALTEYNQSDYDGIENLMVQLPFISIDLIPFIDLDFSFTNIMQQTVRFLWWLKNVSIWFMLYAAGAPAIVVLIMLPLLLLLAFSIAGIFVTPMVILTPWFFMHFIFLPVTWPFWYWTYDAACSTDANPPITFLYILAPPVCLLE